MAKIIGLPKLSPTMEEGTLVSWTKKEGDAVEVDDLLAEVETDKATMEFRSFDRGVLLKILVPEGETLEPDVPVAIIGKAGEDIDEWELACGAEPGGGQVGPEHRCRRRRDQRPIEVEHGRSLTGHRTRLLIVSGARHSRRDDEPPPPPESRCVMAGHQHQVVAERALQEVGDRPVRQPDGDLGAAQVEVVTRGDDVALGDPAPIEVCLLYTSDAADDL